MITPQNFDRMIKMLEDGGIINKEHTDLTPEYYRQWRRIEESLSRSPSVERARQLFPDMKSSSYRDIAKMASIFGFFPNGLHSEDAENASQVIDAILSLIPVWVVPNGERP